jgi:endonuclease YncB( thermonuclease family)
VNEWIAIGLVATALAGMWFSTRQASLAFRIVVWLFAVAALLVVGWNAFFSAGATSRAVSVAAGALEFPEVRGALSSNLPTVDDALAPMIAMFLLAGIVLAVATALALTPGDKLERAARPIILLSLGASGGVALALAGVALGFGGYLKPREYIAPSEDVSVIDGDTLKVQDVTLRLDGIDAPELDQRCLDNGAFEACGERSHYALMEMISGNLIVCRRRDANTAIPPTEALGRPVVVCIALSREGSVDLSDAMLRQHWAVEYVRPRRARSPIRVGEACTIHPSHWRGDASRRATFEQNGGECGDSSASRR